MNSKHPRFTLVGLVFLLGACATLADAASGGDNLPNAAAGPFRVLRTEEVGNLRTAPNVLADDQTFPRDGTILDADDDPATPEVIGYFATNPFQSMTKPDPAANPGAIVRHGATDGRSFDSTAVTVLLPEQPWEGDTVGAPSAVRVDGEVFLYYTAAGGIGLARSSDGTGFTRETEPVLVANQGSWEMGNVPKNPGVVRLDDGSLRMFYEVEFDDGTSKIGEARSEDGISWERVGNAAVLEARPDIDVNDPFFDDVSVGAPHAVLTRSTEGRAILRVYYAARDSLDHQAIGLAGRYDPASGPLERAVAPVFAGSLGPGQPCVVVRPGYSLLFVTELAGKTKTQQFPAIAAAVSPADAVLPPRTE